MGYRKVSILSPTLFILYISDLCNIFTLLKFILFSLMILIYFVRGNIQPNSAKLSILNYESYISVFSVNRLCLNVAKTNYMLFGNYCTKTNIDK